LSTYPEYLNTRLVHAQHQIIAQQRIGDFEIGSVKHPAPGYLLPAAIQDCVCHPTDPPNSPEQMLKQCRMHASTRSLSRHAEIMFGVLVEVLHLDSIAFQRRLSRKRKIALIVPTRVTVRTFLP